MYAATAMSALREGILQFGKPPTAHLQRAHARRKGPLHGLLPSLQEQGVPSQTPCTDAQCPPSEAQAPMTSKNLPNFLKSCQLLLD